tara:strand:+ start:851 stop:1261 length:411 start_codon:yes stop_codon:yes gene_type:complete
MARITVEDCIDKFDSRFELVLVASNRARKLHTGEQPTVDKDNDKNTVIALREIASESLSSEELKKNLIEEYQTVSEQSEEDLSPEYSDSEEISDNENKEGDSSFHKNSLENENNINDISDENLQDSKEVSLSEDID